MKKRLTEKEVKIQEIFQRLFKKDAITIPQSERNELLSTFSENDLVEIYSNCENKVWLIYVIIMILNNKSQGNSTDIMSLLSQLKPEFNLETDLLSLLKSCKPPNIMIEIELIQFFITLSNKMDEAQVGKCIMKLVGIELLWNHVCSSSLEKITAKYSFLKKKEESTNNLVDFIPMIVLNSLMSLQELEKNFGEKEQKEKAKEENSEQDDLEEVEMEDVATLLKQENLILHLSKTLQLLIELLSQISTRRFLLFYLLDVAYSTTWNMKLSFISSSSLRQLFDMYQMYEKWNIDAFQKQQQQKPQLEYKVTKSQAMVSLQKMTYELFTNKCRNILFRGISVLSTHDSPILRHDLELLSQQELLKLVKNLQLVNISVIPTTTSSREFLIKLLLDRYTVYPTIIETFMNRSLFPTETSFSELNQVVLPNLKLQFLSLTDYFYRHFILTQQESFYSILEDLQFSLKRLDPIMRYNEETNQMKTAFKGWARMGLEVSNVKLTSVGAIPYNERHASHVHGEFMWDLVKCNTDIRLEWDEELQEFDNLFLIWIDATFIQPESNDIMKQLGIKAIRGCTIIDMKDEDGDVISKIQSHQNILFASSVIQDDEVIKTDDLQDEIKEKTRWNSKKQKLELIEPPKPKKYEPRGTKRFIKVSFDSAQYSIDSNYTKTNMQTMNQELYQKFNYIIKRSGKRNNFKSILSTIRNMLYSTQDIYRVLPNWFHEIVLGYGNPLQAKTKEEEEYDFYDSFFSSKHLVQSFQNYNIYINGEKVKDSEDETRMNYKVKIIEKTNKLYATSYPFNTDHTFLVKINGNQIQFTPSQIKAIQSGISQRLTLIIGPPGTGKTDVAVQIISALHHTKPNETILLITHSNAALNDLFEKVHLNVHARYLLRLGYGERTKNFTKMGRVDYLLQRRLELLHHVQKLSELIGISDQNHFIVGNYTAADPLYSSYTCETAMYFYKQHVLKLIEKFEMLVKFKSEQDNVIDLFPFPLRFFQDNATALTLQQARLHKQSLHNLFQEIMEYQPLELLRTQRQRINYLLLKQSRIIAMTCTHASIVRDHLLKLNFNYDTVIVEEAGQMVEMDSFVTFCLQKSQKIKRICLIGDPFNQLPPILQNHSLREAHYDQSLFCRLLRLGVPHVLLDKQGRSRESIAELYSWRYENMKHLDHVLDQNNLFFQLGNPGLRYEFQFIDVQDYQGTGESSPTRHFFQNLGEAEYIIALYEYMIYIGYPAEKITILAAYNGQKDLIKDVISQKCRENQLLQKPAFISTIDQYQGQQNDYILLSLVRTKSIGYLNDIRRWIVALSRAKLGIYVFGRKSLFQEQENNQELKKVMSLLLPSSRSGDDKLKLVKGEFYGNIERKISDEIDEDLIYEVKDVEDMGALASSLKEELLESLEEEEVDEMEVAEDADDNDQNGNT